MNKKAEVFTNDPVKPSATLTITGTVETLYTLSPKRVRLEGFQGEVVKQTVTVVTKEQYPLHVLSATPKTGENIRLNLTEEKEENVTRYKLTVENTRQAPGRFIDTLVLKTDNPTLPEIKIPVYGFIKEPAENSRK